MHLEKK